MDFPDHGSRFTTVINVLLDLYSNLTNTMMKHLIYSVGLLLLCPCLSFSQTTYYSQSSGTWRDAGMWNTEADGSGVAFVESAVSPFGDPTANFVVQNNNDITLPTGITQVNNLTVNSGGKLYDGNSANTFIEVSGSSVSIDGQMGNGETFDGISLDIVGASCTISGGGQIDLSRIEKDNSSETTTQFTISSDLNLRFAGTALFNNATGSNEFNVLIEEGVTVNVLGNGGVSGDISIDGIDGGNSTSFGFGTFTVDGTLDISGDLFLITDNNTSVYPGIAYVINGTLKVGGKIFGNSGESGTASADLTLSSGAILELSGSDDVFSLIDASRNTLSIAADASIVYSGTSTQQIFGDITYGNMRLNGGGDKELASDVTVSNTLTLASGDIITGANKLIVESTASNAIQGASTSSYIVGNLQRRVVASTSYSFPIGEIGDADGYNPFTLDVMAGLSGTEEVEASFSSTMVTIDEERTCETDEGTQRLSYACAAGNWDINSNDFSYEITLQPSTATQTACTGATLFPSIRKVEGVDQSLGCNEGIEDIPFSSFSTFSIAYAATAVAAPVELLGFDVEAEGNAAVLWWATATETNNSHFVIERSADGFVFEAIAQVEGRGTSLEPQEYQYRDSTAGPGHHYYRLKQVDFNGDFEYFSIREVRLSGGEEVAAILAAYPNPTDRYYNMEMQIPDPKNAHIQVFDLRGNRIYEAHITNCNSGYNAIEMDVSTWESGVYLYLIAAGPDVIRGKIIRK